MKSLALATVLLLTSLTAFSRALPNAGAPDLTPSQAPLSERVRNLAVIQSTFQLLNAASSKTCESLEQSPVQTPCLGAFPSDIKKPTAVKNGCAFFLQIHCGYGISAEIRGYEATYAVVGPGGATYDQADLGLNVSEITIHGLGH